MLKENWRFVSRVQRLGDILITVFAFFAAYYGRSSLIYWSEIFSWNLPFEGPDLAPIADYSIVLFVALVGYQFTLSMMGAYSSMRLASSWQLFRLFSVSSVLVFVGLATCLFVLKIDLSRSFIGLFSILMVLCLTAERYLVLAVLRYWRKRGLNFRNVIICGIGEQAIRLAKEINNRRELGIRVRCFADLAPITEPETHKSFKTALQKKGLSSGRIVCGVPAVGKALQDYAIDEILFTDIVRVMPEVESTIVVASEQGVRTTLAADLFSIGLVKSGLSYFGDMPLIHFQTPPGDRWELGVKRGIDVFISAFLLLLLAPFFAVIGLLVKYSSEGPVFYVQRRVGLNGRLFDMYKFRSMTKDADRQLSLLTDLNEMAGPAFKVANDPRVTGIGKFLRRFSLDELPQLWNVLKGDMSLVGPRPPIPGEVSEYQRVFRRRLSMRPGLTCTWQVSGRNEISDFESWVKLDLEYIDNWSLARDFILLLKTIPAVLFGHGAR
jgi:exopolysaccharide biosynthesis polyprenyl glycosylphosphotransferase